jgi:hypothetical protein
MPKLLQLMKECKSIEEMHTAQTQIHQDPKGENPVQMSDVKELRNIQNRILKCFQLRKECKSIEAIDSPQMHLCREPQPRSRTQTSKTQAASRNRNTTGKLL